MSRATVRVVAAALTRIAAGGSAQVLIAQRPPGSWQAGRWEFPGGKVEPAEADEAAVHRELREELGISVLKAIPVDVFTHSYPDRSVEIALWVVPAFAGEPLGLDGQALRWVSPAELSECDLLEADLPMIAPLLRALE
ncbi:MAG: (deoxy)nucleoside triphosphate pyrophosphohydrolase [Steroidobacteraceae bacterium]